jgi:hypothetical protein
VPEADAAWRLLQFAWNRNYVGAWQALQAHQWSAQAQPLVDALVEKTRQRMLKLIAAAYSQVGWGDGGGAGEGGGLGSLGGVPPGRKGAPLGSKGAPVECAGARHVEAACLPCNRLAQPAKPPRLPLGGPLSDPAKVSPAKAAQLLGVSEADARQLAQSVGWTQAVDGAMLAPSETAEDGAGLDCRAALEQLVQYMVHLES